MLLLQAVTQGPRLFAYCGFAFFTIWLLLLCWELAPFLPDSRGKEQEGHGRCLWARPESGKVHCHATGYNSALARKTAREAVEYNLAVWLKIKGNEFGGYLSQVLLVAWFSGMRTLDPKGHLAHHLDQKSSFPAHHLTHPLGSWTSPNSGKTWASIWSRSPTPPMDFT